GAGAPNDEAAAADEPSERSGEDMPAADIATVTPELAFTAQPGVDMSAADLAPAAPELALTAQPDDEADLITDDLTLALTQGDLDLTTVPLFDGPEFALPPVDATIAATDEPQLWTGDQASTTADTFPPLDAASEVVASDESQLWAGEHTPVASDTLPQPDAPSGELSPALGEIGGFDFASFGDILPVLEQEQPMLADAQAAALPTALDASERPDAHAA
ncbi:hypothetical protein SE17_41770, partial [Kouleothrix aurantiaca]